MKDFTTQGQNNTGHHAAVITPREIAYGNGTVNAAKPGLETALPQILDGTIGRFATHSTLVIDGVKPEQIAHHSDTVRALGWQHAELGAWTLFHRADGRTVAIGLRDAMQVPHLGLLFGRDTNPRILAMLLDRYHRATGNAWRGTAATSALAAIRLSWGNQRYQPLWRLDNTGPRHSTGPLSWSREITEHEKEWGYVHTFDANSAYLGSAITAEVAWSKLHHTGPQIFDRGLPGYWLIELDTSTLALLRNKQRPPLLGRIREGRAMVTTPYGRLLEELGDHCLVIDSWTARSEQRTTGTRLHPAGSRVLRRWGESLRDGLDLELPPAVRDAVKRTYKDAIGGMQREGMRIYRPDWGHTIIDLWRATLLRTIYRVEKAIGITPVRVATDSIAYAYTDAIALARAIGVRPGLGGFKHEHTMKVADWIVKYGKGVRR